MSEEPVKYGSDNTRDAVRRWIGTVPEAQDADDVEFIEVRLIGRTLDALHETAKANGLTPAQMIERLVGHAVNEVEQ